MNDIAVLVDRAVATIVAAAPPAPDWEQIHAERRTSRWPRSVPMAAAAGLTAAAAVAAVIVLPRESDAPDHAVPAVTPSAAEETAVPATTGAAVPLRPIRGAAVPTWLPDGLVVWDVVLGDGTTPVEFIPGRYSDVNVGSADNPFADDFTVTAEPATATLDELREDTAGSGELVDIGGVMRLVTPLPGGSLVRWIDDGIVIGVWNSGTLNDEELERVVTGVELVGPAPARATQSATWEQIATMPTVATATLDGETLELHALTDNGARALCAVDAADTRRCRLLIDEGTLAGNPTGDVIVAIDDGTAIGHTYGWISVPATVEPWDPSVAVVQQVVDGQTWFRIDTPPGTGSLVDVVGPPDDTAQFTRNFGVGDTDAQAASACLRDPNLGEEDGCPPPTS